MDILDRIRTYKLQEIADRRCARPLSDLEAEARQASPPRGFARALRETGQSRPALIAEIKRASPSRGLIRADFDPPALARAYEAGGAACLSVLTDGPSFGGSEAVLQAARAAASLPCLRKDFLFDPWQAVESRAIGADCVLLIMAALEDARAAEIEAAAMEWGMDVLIEVHDEPELERALRLRSPLVGINNRDLRSFAVSLDVTRRLARHVPPDRLIVAESGIHHPEDVADLRRHGARAFLVGESLMREPDVEGATRRLLSVSVPAASP